MARHSGAARSRLHDESVRLRVGRRIAATLLVGSVTAFAALLGSSSGGPARLVRDLILFNLAHLAAACLCWWPRVETVRHRRAWRLLTIALLLSVAGNIFFTLIPGATLTPALGAPAISDLFYLSSYPVMNIAAILLVRERGRHIVSAVWLDGLVIGLSAATVSAALVLAPLLRLESLTTPQAVTDLAYPLADLTLLIVLATVAGMTRLRLDPRLALLGFGLGLILVTDLAYLALDLSRSYREGDPVDLGWLLALLPLAGRLPPRARSLPDPNRQTTPIERAAIAAPTTAALIALAVLTSGYYTALPPAAGALAGACILVALVRAALTLHQLQALPEARRQARTDPLTDVANRRHLHEWCGRLLTRPDAAPVTLLMIDLDGFKFVNDHHGHPVGDALLVEVASRFAATMRHDDLLGRLGGDEFAAVLPRTTPRQARMVAQRMHAALTRPILVAGHAFRINASVGVSAAGRPGMHPDLLFREADMAMYRAKKARAGTAVATRDWPQADRHPHHDDLARRRA